MTPETRDTMLSSIADLPRLAHDPVAFSTLRREVLRAYLQTSKPESLQHLMKLQDEIENTCAIAGAPQKALIILLEMLKDQAEALDSLCAHCKDITSSHSS